MIRDSSGQWLCGFSKFVGDSSAYIAELWGVYEGLQLAKQKGFSHVELQVDSKIVADGLNSGSIGSSSGWSLIRRIRSLISEDWNIKIVHIYRESNKGVDFLANIGCNLDSIQVVYVHPPPRLFQLLVSDTMRVSSPRIVPV